MYQIQKPMFQMQKPPNQPNPKILLIITAVGFILLYSRHLK